MSSTPRRILVAGATGKQGGALISALLSQKQPTQPFHIVGLTRNANSERAQSLAKESNVSILEGDLNDCPAIFKKSSEPFYGVFSVQTPLKPAVEEQQGKALVDAAAANGVRYFIYTSAERGGPEKSDRDGTSIKHFRSKFNIENHLKEVAARTEGMEWTIIRPVAFMDNMSPGFLGKAFATMWELNGMDSTLQLVPSSSIGILAADAFLNPEKYASKAISLATDSLTRRDAGQIFKRVVGTELPTTYHFVGRLIRYLLHEQLGEMFDWFKNVGFGADPREYTRQFSEMQDFETWLRESSGFKGQV